MEGAGERGKPDAVHGSGGDDDESLRSWPICEEESSQQSLDELTASRIIQEAPASVTDPIVRGGPGGVF